MPNSLLNPNATMTMSSREIAELVESRHDSVKRAIERCAERGVIDIPPMVEYRDAVGRGGQHEYKLDKRSSLIVVAQLSPEFTARVVDRWQELEQVVAQPRVGYSPKEIVEFADALAKSLNVEGSGKLNMLRVSLEGTGHGSLTFALPAYAVDAPTGSTAGSSEPTASLTTLLKKHGIGITAAKANLLLQAFGILELKTRPSSVKPDVLRSFWSVTEKGLAYGKNVTNEKNQRETQPHLYESKFTALCADVGILPC